jgi:hypothetical protein
MTIGFNESAKSSLSGLESGLTKELRLDAAGADWPLEAIETLYVVIDGLSISIKYENAYASKIEDLEYGTEDESPRPVFRKFLDKHGSVISNQIADWSLNYLSDSGVIP